ncbi:hypothetical protein E2C01_019758 [Portunus trituberculatus]|uniref:Uncharacterized protein n=1 Tax=Portunus trituberculatus TaxID=210409 RepID=A0A5B7E094_PORTR|nr:hypothetical protein [Portunus trituberculatus]
MTITSRHVLDSQRGVSHHFSSSPSDVVVFRHEATPSSLSSGHAPTTTNISPLKLHSRSHHGARI